MGRGMRRLLLAAGLAAGVVSSSEASDWKADAAEMVKDQYARVKTAEWVDGFSLWLTAYDTPDVSSWSFVAEHIVCPILDAAGKPAGSFVTVAFYDFQGSGTDRPRRMGEAACS